MFWMKDKKNGISASNTHLYYYIKLGFKGVHISWTCFHGGNGNPPSLARIDSRHEFIVTDATDIWKTCPFI